MGRVVVIHPDLGVGGAERLIVDASTALQECGHEVRIYTGYHDKNRCFQETKDGTLKTFTIGSWIPRAIFGRCLALMAYLKMMYIAFYLLIYSQHDLVLCDQVSACIPILKLDFRNRAKIVFYCHFPDQLLTQRRTLIKSLYRKPLDYLEEVSTRLADIILVNSKFTSSVVKRTFRSLKSRNLTILYPCVDVTSFISSKPTMENCSEVVREIKQYSINNYIFLSLNRFERKKNLALVIEALRECISGFQQATGNDDNNASDLKVKLIVAGGYDERLQDSVQYYAELENLVKKLNLNSYVMFAKSPSDNEKLMLLQMSHSIVYTPKNEHFGIVPLEAMAMSKPVIASATGGPLETIETGINGFLCECDKYSFADAMLKLFSDRKLSAKMGASGLDRVKRHFSYETFRDRLNEICYPSQQQHSNNNNKK